MKPVMKTITALLLAFVMASCNENKPAKNADSVDPVTDLQTQPASEVSDTNAAVISMDPGQSFTISQGGEQLNPAHGEPGHRCDIAVGAPLNSPPGNPGDGHANEQTITMEVPEITEQPVVSTGKTAPGMNPPHGEPGHDCAVPVGSPLKK
jgi:hypothetical protein